MLNLEDKVALITGGANGIGLEYTKSLLKHNIKSIILVDSNLDIGEKVENELNEDFGPNKVLFVKADVSNRRELENAFRIGVEKFKQLDIVINNAGIVNDKNFEQQININCLGVVYGTLLAIEEYLVKYRKAEEGIVVNISSLFGLDPNVAFPIYSATKFFVLGFSQAIGDQVHYEKTKIKVLTICPGITETAIADGVSEKAVSPHFSEINFQVLSKLEIQPPSHMGKELITILEKGKSGSVWLVEGNRPAMEVHSQNRFERVGLDNLNK